MTEWNNRSSALLPHRTPSEEVMIAADIRLDYRTDLLSGLKSAGAVLQEQTDIALLAAAYHTWGTECVHHLEGDYAFVLWDARRHMLYGARSLTGLRPFVFHRSSQTLMCASEAKVLLASERIEKRLHRDWIASWLVTGHDSWDCTPYEGIEKLPAGHTIMLDERGIHIEAFWQPSSKTLLSFDSQQDYTEQFRSLLFAAVHSRLHPSVPCFIDISGGLDSSSIACIIGELRRQGAILPLLYGIHAYSPHFQENDDRHLAAMVAEATAIPVSYFSYDEFEPFRGLFHPRLWTDSPALPLLLYTEFYERLFHLAAHNHVQAHIRGDFGDQLCDLSPRYVRQLATEHHYLQLLGEVWAWKQSGTISAFSVLLSSLGPPWSKHRQTQVPPLYACVPWVRPEIVERGIERNGMEAELLRRLVPDPVTRHFYHAILQHDDYIAQQNDGIIRAGVLSTWGQSRTMC